MTHATPPSTDSTPGTTEVCWICQSRATKVVKPRSIDRALTPSDLAITDHRYGQTLTLRRCADCGFLFAEGAEMAELIGVYERLDDPGYEETQDTRALQMEWLLKQALAARPAARTLLDIGAGAGLMVAKAKDAGLEATGIEPSRALVAAARRVNRVELLQGTFPHPDLAGRTFDIVTLVDVIEHVNDPVGLLRDIACSMGERSLLLVVTPDRASLTARMMGFRWWHYRLAHVGYFDPATLRRAAERAGLRIIGQRRAKWFFRVGYLAERAAEYLPIRWFNRLAERVRLGRWIFSGVIPVNLHDSVLVMLELATEPTGRDPGARPDASEPKGGTR
ncbi:MAG: class I SAM-dependent methyltransferase [Phycisphaerales bacterium]|nr:class I SAM-dependent methyltransferase [Phycisphaerales bacterium]